MSNRVSKYGLSCSSPDFTELEQCLFLEIAANRFLHSMVRAIVGAMIAVASGKMSITEFKDKFKKIDAPVLYLDGPDYENYVGQVYKKEAVLIEKLNLKELLKN